MDSPECLERGAGACPFEETWHGPSWRPGAWGAGPTSWRRALFWRTEACRCGRAEGWELADSDGKLSAEEDAVEVDVESLRDHSGDLGREVKR